MNVDGNYFASLDGRQPRTEVRLRLSRCPPPNSSTTTTATASTARTTARAPAAAATLPTVYPRRQHRTTAASTPPSTSAMSSRRTASPSTSASASTSRAPRTSLPRPRRTLRSRPGSRLSSYDGSENLIDFTWTTSRPASASPTLSTSRARRSSPLVRPLRRAALLRQRHQPENPLVPRATSPMTGTTEQRQSFPQPNEVGSTSRSSRTCRSQQPELHRALPQQDRR
jgi:hypothetical protein